MRRALVSLLAALGFLVHKGRPGKDLRFVVTEAGSRWLAAPLHERLRELLDTVRGRIPEDGKLPPSPPDRPHLRLVGPDTGDVEFLHDGSLDFDDLDDLDDFDLNDYVAAALVPPAPVELLPLSVYPDSLKRDMERALTSAFGRLPAVDVIPLADFLDYEAREHNPLLDPELPGHARVGGVRLVDSVEEDQENTWQSVLVQVMLNWLVPLGGLRVADLGNGYAGVGLTAAGRYALRLTDNFEPAAAMETGIGIGGAGAPAVIVQPNFDVVFMAPSPAAEAEIGRFADRTGRRVGTLFRITRQSVLNAAAGGVEADGAIAGLERLCAQPLPGNVEHEMRNWWATARRIRVERTWVARCPDPETAARVLAAAGSAAKRLGPTAVELPGAKVAPAVARKLKQAGIFLEQADLTPGKSSRRGKRR